MPTRFVCWRSKGSFSHRCLTSGTWPKSFHRSFPDERLIVCRNPLLAAERARKRAELLAATERQLDEIVAATRRARKPLSGQAKIGLRVGRVLNRHKVGKHFELTIGDGEFLIPAGRRLGSQPRQSWMGST